MWLQLIGEEPTTKSVIPSGCQTRGQTASAAADGGGQEKGRATELESPKEK